MRYNNGMTEPAALKEPIVAATLKGDAAALRRQLKPGTELNAPTAAGATILHTAAMGESTKVIDLLVEHGADINGRDKFGKTPLHLAARQGRPEIVQHLIDHGADVNAMAKNGSFPLDWAIKFDHEAAAARLRQGGAETGKPLR